MPTLIHCSIQNISILDWPDQKSFQEIQQPQSYPTAASNKPQRNLKNNQSASHKHIMVCSQASPQKPKLTYIYKWFSNYDELGYKAKWLTLCKHEINGTVCTCACGKGGINRCSSILHTKKISYINQVIAKNKGRNNHKLWAEYIKNTTKILYNFSKADIVYVYIHIDSKLQDRTNSGQSE